MAEGDWFLGEPGSADTSQFSAEDASAGDGLSASSYAPAQSNERYLVRWRMALVYDDREDAPTYHGRTHDLNFSGTCMLAHVNMLRPRTPVILLLLPPPLDVKERPRIIEVRSRQLDSVYTGEHMCFRLGFAFQEFKNNGLEFLRERLRMYRTVTKLSQTKTINLGGNA
jgi:hypothetical protein